MSDHCQSVHRDIFSLDVLVSFAKKTSDDRVFTNLSYCSCRTAVTCRKLEPGSELVAQASRTGELHPDVVLLGWCRMGGVTSILFLERLLIANKIAQRLEHPLQARQSSDKNRGVAF